MNRKKLWQIHSWIGLIVGLPLILIALTGSLLVWHDEINNLIMPNSVLVEPTAEGRLPLNHLKNKAELSFQDYHPVAWLIHENPHRSDDIYLWKKGDSEWLRAFINPYTGEVLHKPIALTEYFMEWLVELHYTFLAGHLGMLMGGIIALLLCVMAVLGFMIYRKFWLNFFTLRWKKSARVLLADVHSRIGVISSPIFLLLGITGAWWNLTHAITDLYEHGIFDPKETPITEPSYSRPLSLDAMILQAQEHLPGYQVRFITFPRSKEENFRFFGELPTKNFLRSPYGSTVTFSSDGNTLVSTTDIRTADAWPQIEDTFRKLHFGNFGGLSIKIIWCIVGFAPGVLAMTGFIVWWKRKKTKSRRR
ncbi:PepSY domain-containing protein [bacterium]|nr:PepSY domain-containing protein [bacterium]